MATSAQELWDWIEWEGGPYSMMQHGLDIDDIEDEKLRDAVLEMEQAFDRFDGCWDRVKGVLSDLGVDI